MNLTELRAIANNNNSGLYESVGANFEDMFINEVYLGRDDMKEIEDVITKIVDKVRDNPNINLQKDPLSRELESKFVKVFGFRKCRIYWSNIFAAKGPYTRPAAKILHVDSKSFTHGLHKKGFYDEKHELAVYIQMDQNLITDCNLTASEVLAVILHEVGHNFDYSPAQVFLVWYNFIANLLSNHALEYLAKTVTQEYGRGVMMTIDNINDYLYNTAPSIGNMLRRIGKTGFNVLKFLQAIGSPLAITMVPLYMLCTPFLYLTNTFTRKGEVYADSFAASYGYGPECISALEKIYAFVNTKDTDNGFMQFFYDMALFHNEVICFASGGHRTNQQRMLSMIDKLEDDLKNNIVDPSDKKELEAELKRAKDMYNKLINLDQTERDTLTMQFRRCVDNWHNGKPYMIIAPIGNGQDNYAN